MGTWKDVESVSTWQPSAERPFRSKVLGHFLTRLPHFLLTLISSARRPPRRPRRFTPRHGPSSTMRSVALSALIAVAAAGASNAEESKPVFKVRAWFVPEACPNN